MEEGRSTDLGSEEVFGVKMQYKSDRRTSLHCKQSVSLKTFKTHKRLFHNDVRYSEKV